MVEIRCNNIKEYKIGQNQFCEVQGAHVKSLSSLLRRHKTARSMIPQSEELIPEKKKFSMLNRIRLRRQTIRQISLRLVRCLSREYSGRSSGSVYAATRNNLSSKLAVKIRILKRRQSANLIRLDALSKDSAVGQDNLKSASSELLHSQNLLFSVNEQLKKMIDESQSRPLKDRNTDLPDRSDLNEEITRGQALERHYVLLKQDKSNLAMRNSIISEYLLRFSMTFRELSQDQLASQLLGMPNMINHIRDQTGDKYDDETLNSHKLLNSGLLLLQERMYMLQLAKKSAFIYKRLKEKKHEQIKQVKRDLMNMMTACQVIQKKHQPLAHMFESANHRLAELYLYYGGTGGKQTCLKCYKVFSLLSQKQCQTHQSPWSGKLYFCYGNDFKGLKGCSTTRHQSQDSMEIASLLSSKARKKGLSCDHSGHQTINCQKDPKARSVRDFSNEALRIKGLKKWKPRRIIVKGVVKSTRQMKDQTIIFQSKISVFKIQMIESASVRCPYQISSCNNKFSENPQVCQQTSVANYPLFIMKYYSPFIIIIWDGQS